MIPIHPQACPGAPQLLRWVAPAAAIPFVGLVAEAPAELAALLADGTLSEVSLEPAAVLTRLTGGRTWSAEGPRVRTALHCALSRPGGWRPVTEQRQAPSGAGQAASRGQEQAVSRGQRQAVSRGQRQAVSRGQRQGQGVPQGEGQGTAEDLALSRLAGQLLTDDVGPLAATHGGGIELVEVRDGVVRVRLAGACDGCPAASGTLHLRLEAQLRRSFPGARVIPVDGGGGWLSRVVRRPQRVSVAFGAGAAHGPDRP